MLQAEQLLTALCQADVADQSFASIRVDNEELLRLLVAIVKTSKGPMHAS